MKNDYFMAVSSTGLEMGAGYLSIIIIVNY